MATANAGGGQGDGVRVFWNTGNGVFGPGQPVPLTSQGPRPVRLRGVHGDNDGRLDLMVSIDNGFGALMRNSGGQTFADVGWGLAPEASDSTTADFARAGRPTVVSVRPTRRRMPSRTSDGDGSYPGIDWEEDLGRGSSAMALGSFNALADHAVKTRDDALDIAIVNTIDESVEVWLWQADLPAPDGTNEQPRGIDSALAQTIAVGPRPASLAVGDFTGDGTDDLAVGCVGDATVKVFRGLGDGTFVPVPWVVVPVGEGPGSVVAADFNLDGLMDLAVACDRSQATSVTAIGGLGSDPVRGSGAAVSDDGTVMAGQVQGVPCGGNRAFRWTQATGIVCLGTLPGDTQSAAGLMTPDGSVIAGTSSNASGVTRAFRWRAATGMVELPAPAGRTNAIVKDISADGNTVLGEAWSVPGQTVVVKWDAAGVPTVLPGLPNLSRHTAAGMSLSGAVVAGNSTNDDVYHAAWVWTPAGGTETIQNYLVAAGVPGASWQYYRVDGVSDDGSAFFGAQWGSPGFTQYASTGNGIRPAQYSTLLLITRGMSPDGSTLFGNSDSTFLAPAWKWVPASGQPEEPLHCVGYGGDGTRSCEARVSNNTGSIIYGQYSFLPQNFEPSYDGMMTWPGGFYDDGATVSAASRHTSVLVGSIRGNLAIKSGGGGWTTFTAANPTSAIAALSGDGRTAAGSVQNGSRPMVWSRTGGVQDRGGVFEFATSISANGRFVGYVNAYTIPFPQFRQVEEPYWGDEQDGTSFGPPFDRWGSAWGFGGYDGGRPIDVSDSGRRALLRVWSNFGGAESWIFDRDADTYLDAPQFGTPTGMSADGRYLSQHVYGGQNAATVGRGDLDTSNVESMPALPGRALHLSLGISRDGSAIIGESTSPTYTAFVWVVGGQPIEIPFMQTPVDVSDGGRVVVGGRYVWTAATGTVDVGPLLTSLGKPMTGWTGLNLSGVSRDGTVVAGTGTNPSGRQEGFVVTLPADWTQTPRVHMAVGLAGASAATTVISTPTGANALAAGDVNADGKPDLAVTSETGDSVALFTNLTPVTCPSTLRWTEIGGPQPSARTAVAMSPDRFGGIVMFGGRGPGEAQIGETWVWNEGSGWFLASTTGPSPRNSATMVFDTVSQKVLLFGGVTGSTRHNDLWEWDGVAWTRIPNAGPWPSTRYEHAMAYDTIRGVAVVHGGFDGTVAADTWEWNSTTRTWARVATTGPGGRFSHAMAFDWRRGETVLFGGFNNVSRLGDTWAWNGSAWVQKSSTGPSGRFGHAMAFDGSRDNVVLLAGKDTSPKNDAWEWDGASWRERTAVGGFVPGPRFDLSAAHANGRTFLFGGNNDAAFLSQTVVTEPSQDLGIREFDVVGRTTLVEGETLALDVLETVGSGNLGRPGDRWRFNGTPLSDGASVSGSLTGRLRIVGMTQADTGSYSVERWTPCGMRTEWVTVSVSACAAPVISQSPTAAMVGVGRPVTLSASATGDGLTYRWQKDGQVVFNSFPGSRVSGVTTPTLNISSAETGDAGTYTCVVTGVCGSVTTSGASLDVVTCPTAPTASGEGATVVRTQTAVLRATASGRDPFAYQWRRGGQDVVDGGRISGAMTATLTIADALESDSGDYTVTATDPCGQSAQASATLTVGPCETPVIQNQPAATVTAYWGDGVSLAVGATGAGPLSYEWRFGGVPLASGGRISGADTATLTISQATAGDSGRYTVVVSTPCGSRESSASEVTLLDPCAIALDVSHMSMDVPYLSAAQLRVTALSGRPPFTHRWFRDGVAWSDMPTVRGTSGATLSISAMTLAEAGTWSVEVRNGSSCVSWPVASWALSTRVPCATAASEFLPLGFLPASPAPQSAAFGVSADGAVVVGNGWGVSGREGFRWSASTGLVGMGDLPGGTFESFAQGVSADGRTIVGVGRQASGKEGWVWTESGGFVGIGDLPGGVFDSNARSVNADGTMIAGAAHGTLGPATGIQAVTWVAGRGIRSLGDADGGIVGSNANTLTRNGRVAVGSMTDAQGQVAARWMDEGTGQPLGDLPGGAYRSFASSVSDDGRTIVGSSETAAGLEGFVWREGVGMSVISDFPGGGVTTFINAVNADGSVATGLTTTPTGSTAFLWSRDFGMRLLADVLASQGVSTAGWTLVGGTGLSADGSVVVGRGIDPQGREQAFRAVIRGICPADVNGDGFLDFFDFDEFVACFADGLCPGCASPDFNRDGFADFFDYDDFVVAFEAGC